VQFKATVPNTLFGLLAPMKGNLQGARAIDAHFKSGAAAALPAAPQIPAFNAPGYTSVPPQAPQLSAPQHPSHPAAPRA
jgi:hypothetical protein